MKRRRTILSLGLGLAAAGLMWRASTGHWSLLPPASAAPAAAGYDWLQFGFDSQHSGNNTRETTITPANVASLHRLFRVSLPVETDSYIDSFMAVADVAPAYLSSVDTPSGVRDLLFVTTRAGTLFALDAHTGDQVWMKGHRAARPDANSNYMKSSPAIDPNRQFVYSYGLDGNLHRHRVADGSEVTTGGWPELTTLKPWTECVSSALSIATARNGASYLYVTHAQQGDVGDYQGHLTAINLADGSQRVFNALSSDQAVHFVEKPGTPDAAATGAGIWARAGVVYDPDTDRIYMATGNGPFDPSHHDWADSVFSLYPNGTGRYGNPLDSYTPDDYQVLDPADLDLGSTAPAIMPAPAGSAVQHLALQGGKDGRLRLLNLDNLNGQSRPGYPLGGEVGTQIVFSTGAEVLTAPAVWTNPTDKSTWAFVEIANPFRTAPGTFGGIVGLRLAADRNGALMLQIPWSKNDEEPGSSPIIANGVLFYASGSGSLSGARGGVLHALDPTTGAELWSDPTIGGIHMESPIVCNGVLYITDESRQVTAYAP